MNEKIKRLLKPRFKVIAKYPCSPYKMGEIKVCADRDFGDVNYYKEYPAIFQELQWYEERTIEEMPKHVKRGKSVYKVKKHFSSSFTPSTYTAYGCLVGQAFHSYKKLEPATVDEYNAYKTKK